MNKILYIVRGLPGSGKSTLAKTLVNDDFLICEADDYFYDEAGNYNFDASKLKTAHEWCLVRTEHHMEDSIKQIVVSNTFTREWEMQTYVDLAERYGYTVFSLIVENRHGGSNKHGVPVDVIKNMKNRFEIKL